MEQIIAFLESQGIRWYGASQLSESLTAMGEGMLGIDPFRFICEDPRFDNVPLILETPDESRWSEEIATLKGFAGE